MSRAWVAAALTVAGCAPQAASDRSVLVELERLAFVPRGRIVVDAHELVIADPLLVDKYEVTRAELARMSDVRDPWLAAHMGGWTPESGSWPAGFVTQAEAAAHAARRGMRLPTTAEWLLVAMGRDRMPYPFGPIVQESLANTLDLELRPQRPTPVGTFENGRTPSGCYDMLGNVWEWCADGLPGVPERESLVAALGGSYLMHERPIWTERTGYFARELDPRGRHVDVGFRCVAEARGWLAARLAGLDLDDDARTRLVAVGRSWGSVAAPFLRELAGSAGDAGAERALRALLGGAAP
jgi:hypothetical protein